MSKTWLSGLVIAAGVGFLIFCSSASTRADELGRYYHWPYSGFHQQYWTPYEYQPVYDNQYRYPIQARRYPQVDQWRNWSRVSKPYYRGYHFILDQF